LSQISNQYLTLVPMIGLGICWASMVGVPYLMVASMVPRERTGVYMGILNMMIVVPMLVETVTFGWIFEHLLGGKATNAMLVAGVLLALAAVSMLWVNPPHTSEESDFMPLGRHHISIYRNVIVGSDGTDASMYAVDRAHAVAAEADAHVLVVSAYNTGPEPSDLSQAGARREIYGKEAALTALQRAVKHLTTDRVRNVSTRMVPGGPAEALLDAAGSDRQNLIVVGNRGLGAAEGHELGSVPSEIVHQAECDVLIVQVPENAESEYT
jgi:maltose/moltooligosaccharide transporter